MRCSRNSDPSPVPLSGRSSVKTVTWRRSSSADILRVLEAQSAQADRAVVDAVAVEVDDVVRLARAAGAVELLAQGRQRGRVEDVDLDQAGQRLHRLDQRQRARAVVDVAAGVVLRSRRDEQDADRRGDDGDVEHPRVRQAPADAHRPRALEQVAVAVVEELPRQAEQERGGFLGVLDLVLRRAGRVTRRAASPISGCGRGSCGVAFVALVRRGA